MVSISASGGLAYYHTPEDTPKNLSQRTLQHYGSCVLPLVAWFDGADDRAMELLLKPGDATFFPLWRGLLAHYPSWLVQVLALATAGLFVFVVVRNLCRSVSRFRFILLSLVISLLAAVLSFRDWRERRFLPRAPLQTTK